MDMSKVRFNAKPLKVPHIVAKKIGGKRMRAIKKKGGIGPIQDMGGSTKQFTQIMQDGRVGTFNFPDKKKHGPRSQEEVEYQDMLERTMERESSGRHRRTSSLDEIRARKRLKTWIDLGRPVQGVDE